MSPKRVWSVVIMIGLVAAWPQSTQAARLRPPTIFVPGVKDGVKSFYVNGQPLAILLSDSLSVMLALDVDDVGGRDLVRLWAFVQNNSDATIELIPQSQFMLKALSLDFTLVRLARPQTPTAVIQRLEDAKTSRQALAMLAGAVASLGAALSTTNTSGSASTTYSPGLGSSTTTFKVHDAQEKLGAKLDLIGAETGNTVTQLQRLYEGAKAAVSSEMLRRNTLPPGLSANGYLFFENESAEVVEAPDIRNRKFEKARDQTYVVFVRIPGFPEQRVSFWASEGE